MTCQVHHRQCLVVVQPKCMFHSILFSVLRLRVPKKKKILVVLLCAFDSGWLCDSIHNPYFVVGDDDELKDGQPLRILAMHHQNDSTTIQTDHSSRLRHRIR